MYISLYYHVTDKFYENLKYNYFYSIIIIICYYPIINYKKTFYIYYWLKN